MKRWTLALQPWGAQLYKNNLCPTTFYSQVTAQFDVVKRQKMAVMTATVLNNPAIYSSVSVSHFLAHVVNSWLIYDNKML